MVAYLCPLNLLYIEKLASTVNGTEAQCTNQDVRIEKTVSKMTTDEIWDSCCTWKKSR